MRPDKRAVRVFGAGFSLCFPPFQPNETRKSQRKHRFFEAAFSKPVSEGVRTALILSDLPNILKRENSGLRIKQSGFQLFAILHPDHLYTSLSVLKTHFFSLDRFPGKGIDFNLGKAFALSFIFHGSLSGLTNQSQIKVRLFLGSHQPHFRMQRQRA